MGRREVTARRRCVRRLIRATSFCGLITRVITADISMNTTAGRLECNVTSLLVEEM